MTSRFLPPVFQALDAKGKALPGAKLFFFEVGSSTTLKNTFKDGSSTADANANANPVPANGAGIFPNIFGPGLYRVVLKNSKGVQQWERDNVIWTDGTLSLNGGMTLQTAIATDFSISDPVNTTGHTTDNDGGDAPYIVVAGGTGTDDGGSFLDMDNGLQLELIITESIDIGVYGCYIGDASVTLKAALDFCSLNSLSCTGRKPIILNSTIVGDATQKFFQRDAYSESGAGGVFNVVKDIDLFQGTVEKIVRGTSETGTQEAVSKVWQITNAGAVGGYGNRLNYVHTGTLTTGFSIGTASICTFDSINGGQGLARWSVASTPTNTTQNFGVFCEEMNVINASEDTGYGPLRKNFPRWSGGLQLVNEAKDLTRSGNNTFNSLFGLVVAHSVEVKDSDGFFAKTYNGILVEEDSIAPNGRGIQLVGAVDDLTQVPFAGIEIQNTWNRGITTINGIFTNDLAIELGTGHVIEWNSISTVKMKEVSGDLEITADKLRFGTHTATALTISGHIEIKDISGTVRKLAVVT